MRILLDGKDLINLVEHSSPVDLEDFRQTLESKGHQAFERGAEYTPINPFVRRWDYTFHQGESPARLYVAYGLFEIVDTIARRRPDFLLHETRFADELRRRFAIERQMPKGVKKTVAANFPDAMERQMTQRGIQIPSAGIKAFAKWVRADPARCPGFRQSYEMYHAIQANLSDIPKNGDIPDMAHIAALPYVDLLTLDRRMMNYATHVGAKLLKNISAPPYQTRLFRSLAEMLPVI